MAFVTTIYVIICSKFSNERLDCTKLKSYDNISDVDLASWQDLIELQKEHLTQLEADSLKLIKEKTEKFNTYTSIIPVSMGKDSMLTCHLVRKLYPKTKAIFNNTSLDCVDTYRMVKIFPNCEIMNPKKGFYQYVESDHMIPSRVLQDFAVEFLRLALWYHSSTIIIHTLCGWE